MKMLGLAAALLALACAASADYIDWPIKFSQVPWDFYGNDWLSDCTVNVIMADDFVCEDEDMIYALRWWGSYIGETQPRPDGYTGPFHISFHLSMYEHPYSLPGTLVFMDKVEAQEVFVGYDWKGEPVYRYDAYLNSPFDQWLYSQESPNRGELFLDICKPTEEYWGWHEVEKPHPRFDFAAWGQTHNGPWFSTEETDMAFELMTIPEPGTLASFALALSSLGLGLKVWRKK
jgi:hypothetical protein